MAISINSNVSARAAERALNDATSRLGRHLERLSSGMRINRASDDAAGLAIASNLNADARVFGQGLRNLNDGISALNIASSAVGQLSDVLIRLKELASQAANGSFTLGQRMSIHQEANQLSNEYNRIVGSTRFNGLSLLDRTVTQLNLQAGYSNLQFGITDELSRTAGTGSFATISTYSAAGASQADLAVADLNGDGKGDIISIGPGAGGSTVELSILLSNSDGSFQARTTALVASGAEFSATSITAGDFNGDGKIDIVAGVNSSSSAATLQILYGTGTGTFSGSTSLSLGSTANADVESIALGDLDGDGKLDIVVGGDNDLNDSEVSSFRNLGSQSFATRVSYSYITPHTSTVTEVKLRDINGDGRLDLLANTQKTSGIAAFVLFANLNSGSGQFDSYRSLYADGSEAVTSFDLADMNRDGKLDLMISSSPLVDQPDINIALGNGDGTFKNPTNISSLPDVAISDMQAADINGDGYLDLITGGNDGVQTQINVFLGNGDGTFRAPISRTRAGGSSLSNIEIADLNGDGAMEIIGQETGSILDIFNPTTQLLTTTAYLNLTNRDDALAALSVIDQELTRLNLQQGSYGSMLSRLQVAVGNLESSRLNYLSSYGRIVDADIAQESGALLRNSILQDIGSAILAQAYLSPSLALTLLGV